jgi:hypothetical protein
MALFAGKKAATACQSWPFMDALSLIFGEPFHNAINLREKPNSGKT